MKITFFAVFVFLATALNVAAQLNDREIANLKKQINLTSNDIVRASEDATLASGNSLKVFLSIKREGSELKSFQKWIAAWNKKDGNRYGKLELVQDISQADVVLVQFVNGNYKLVEDNSISVRTVPTIGQEKQKVRVGTDRDFKNLKLPVYSYLIKREPELLTIIYSNVETSVPSEQLSVSPEQLLWSSFEQEMKSR